MLKTRENYLIYIYVCILIGLNFILIFNGNFWYDEMYSINLIKMDLGEMLVTTANDVHPPLYYLILWLGCKIFGYNNYTYQIISLIPYVCMVFFSVVVLGKKFGREAAILFCTFISLMPTCVTYNLEVRMYSWGALFIFLCYFELYNILECNNKKNYVLFTIWGLAAAYTHYYCLISVSFFYVVLIILALINRKKYFKQGVVVCVSTVIIYLPWFIVLISTFKRTAGNYWITSVPTLGECIEYMLQGKKGVAIIGLFFLVLFLMYEVGIMQNDEKNKLCFDIKINNRVSNKVVWILVGVVSVLGTALVGIVVSSLYRPMLVGRYLYPISLLIWLIISIAVSRCRSKKIWSILIVMYVLYSCMPQYVEIYQSREIEKIEMYENGGQLNEEEYHISYVSLSS